MGPAAGDTEDPWDHPATLAKIDDLCTAHFQASNRTVHPTNPTSDYTIPPSHIKPSTRFIPQHLLTSSTQYTHPGDRILDKRNQRLDQRHDPPAQQEDPQFGYRPLPEHSPLKSNFHKRKQKVWKPKIRHPKLTLGLDVGLPDACNLALCALVGRLAYKEKCKQSLDSWIKENWTPLLNYSPRILILQQGWLGFIFRKPEDTVIILERFWAFDDGSLMLKRWRLSFNPATEFFSFRHLWVLLPGLPLQLWNQQALELIGSSIGRFLRLDPTTLSVPDRKMARIYVEMDIQAGLPEILEIDW